MSGVDTRTIAISAVLVVLIVAGLYILDPSLGGFLKKKEGFEATMGSEANYSEQVGTTDVPGEQRRRENTQQGFVASQQDQAAPPNDQAQLPAGPTVQGFADLSTMEGPASFGDAQAPAGCYPRDQLTPSELLPRDPNSVWAQQNPMGTGSLKGKNFLSAGALIGINTVGQSLRNANWQIRSEPPNPQVPVSVFYQSTIEPDVNRRTLEIA
jgi:hypothetical protein